MSLLRKQDTLKTVTDVSFVYISLDTQEGSDCVGHWIWECSLFLPYIKELQKELSVPIKILLKNEKRYKRIILSDFGFEESDIIYSTNLVQDNGNKWQNKYVSPMESEYICYVPNFFYLWNVTVNTIPFFEALNKFRDHFMKTIQPIKKTIPLLYIGRSRKENYTNNYREFQNLDTFWNMLEQNNVTILDVDKLQSFQTQCTMVMRSKVIIVEMGSAFTINAGFLATDSHIIIINDNWNYHHSNTPFFQIFRKLQAERNNTIEIFSSNYSGNLRLSFKVDLPLMEKRIQQILFKREYCVICSSSDFEAINSFPHFPIMAISNNSIEEHYFDFNLIACRRCNCLQLQHLTNPSILYSDIYMNATFSPIWMEHHKVFSHFILSNTTGTSFLEIGANKGELYTLLSNERTIEYSVLDIYRHPSLPSTIHYVQGNCETYDFSGVDSVILSHVFEHLYSPHLFIQNIRKACVSSIFISIPNFNRLLEEKSPHIIHSQHTFYCGVDYIIYIMSLYNYKCEATFIHNIGYKSLMFKFVLDPSITPTSIPSTNIQLFKDIYINKIQSMSSIDIPPNSYIIPSGMYGQFLYHTISKKENIIGFLDNNSERHGKKLYGTDKMVFDPNVIDYNNINLIVCECPYMDEIITGLKNICSTIQYIVI